MTRPVWCLEGTGLARRSAPLSSVGDVADRDLEVLQKPVADDPQGDRGADARLLQRPSELGDIPDRLAIDGDDDVAELLALLVDAAQPRLGRRPALPNRVDDDAGGA